MGSESVGLRGGGDYTSAPWRSNPELYLPTIKAMENLDEATAHNFNLKMKSTSICLWMDNFRHSSWTSEESDVVGDHRRTLYGHSETAADRI